MEMKTLEQAIASLDPRDDEHWTMDGLPRIDALVEMTGMDVKRKDVTDRAPELTRDSAKETQHLPPMDEPPVDPKGKELHEAELESHEAEEVPHVCVLDMPRDKVLASYELTCEAVEVITARINERVKERSRLADELQQDNAKLGILTRARTAHERKNPSLRRGLGSAIKDYQEAQKRGREDRAARLRRFTEAGVSAKEVIASIQPSKLDANMRARGQAKRRGVKN